MTNVLYIISAYGHLIPRGKTLTGPEFAAEVRKTYDCAGDSDAAKRNRDVANTAATLPGTFQNIRGVFHYREKKANPPIDIVHSGLGRSILTNH